MDEKQMVIDSTGTVIEELDLEPESVIQVVQLPLISERMAEVHKYVMQSVSDALSMDCTEETYKTVKAVKADLQKEFKGWETRRKEIKSEVNKPYEAFNAVYEECIGRPYKEADAALSKRITEVETGIKMAKAEKVEKYCYELMKTMGVSTEIVNFGQLGIKIGMSESVKKLQEQVAEKIGQIAADLDVISKMPDSAEILVEYKRDRNLAKAQKTVMERKENIRRVEEQKKAEDAQRAERQKKALEAQMAAQQAEQEKAAEQNQIPVGVPVAGAVHVAVPVEKPKENEAPAGPVKMAGLTFRVYGPKDEMLKFRDLLKAYCAEHGLEATGLKKTNIADMQEGINYYG